LGIESGAEAVFGSKTPTYSVQYWLIPLSPVQLPLGLGFELGPKDHLPTPEEDQKVLARFKALMRLYPGAYELRRLYWPQRGPHDLTIQRKVIGRWTSTQWDFPRPPTPSFPF